MEILGVPVAIWHSLIVEEPTGISVFVILAIAARVLADVLTRGKTPSQHVELVREASDNIAYFGSIAAVFFLILSGITGYLIYPYSTLIAQPILVNISILALGALFFWFAFFLLRFLMGADMWSHRGSYLLAVLTAFLALLFDALAASVGAELSLGQSALEPVYNALDFSWMKFTIQPVEIGATLLLVVIGIVIALVWVLRTSRPAS